jgi:hypothetical protein
MLFTERKKLERKYVEWVLAENKSGTNQLTLGNPFNVITFLDSIGMLKDKPHKEELMDKCCNNCRHTYCGDLCPLKEAPIGWNCEEDSCTWFDELDDINDLNKPPKGE